MGNPFNPGSGTKPPFLAGRDNELVKFRASLRAIVDGKHRNLVLTGLRGTGKTVLLNKFFDMCLEEDLFPIKYLNFAQKHNDPEIFDDALKSEISSAMSDMSVTKRVTQKLQTLGSQLKPKRLGSDIFYYEPSYTVKPGAFEIHLRDYLAGNWPVFENKGYKGVMFLFDEFHLVSPNGDKRHPLLTDFIGAINELQNEGFPYYLVLAGLPKLRINVKEARSYTERMFRTMILKNLSKKAASLAISKPLEDSEYSFSQDLIDCIVDETGQYPYFLQLYASELIDHADKKDIGLDDYAKIRDSIVSLLGTDFFDQRMEPLSSAQSTLLHDMATIDDIDMTFATIAESSSVDKRSISTYLKRLEEKGMIYKYKRGIYRFTMPMLKEYLLRKTGKF